jgi:alkylation response protein AidB-like acyl-CoA dehydrogenase
MTTAIETRTDWVALAQQLGTEFAPRAAAHDADDSFVAENFDILKQHSIFAAGVPQELGGGGHHTLSSVSFCVSWHTSAAQLHWPCPCIRTWWPQRCGAGVRGMP